MLFTIENDGTLAPDLELETTIGRIPAFDSQDGMQADVQPTIPPDDDEPIDEVMFPRPGHPVPDALVPFAPTADRPRG